MRLMTYVSCVHLLRLLQASSVESECGKKINLLGQQSVNFCRNFIASPRCNISVMEIGDVDCESLCEFCSEKTKCLLNCKRLGEKAATELVKYFSSQFSPVGKLDCYKKVLRVNSLLIILNNQTSNENNRTSMSISECPLYPIDRKSVIRGLNAECKQLYGHCLQEIKPGIKCEKVGCPCNKMCMKCRKSVNFKKASGFLRHNLKIISNELLSHKTKDEVFSRLLKIMRIQANETTGVNQSARVFKKNEEKKKKKKKGKKDKNGEDKTKRKNFLLGFTKTEFIASVVTIVICCCCCSCGIPLFMCGMCGFCCKKAYGKTDAVAKDQKFVKDNKANKSKVERGEKESQDIEDMKEDTESETSE